MDSVPFVAYLKNGKRFYRWYDWLTWEELQKLYGGTAKAEIMCDKKPAVAALIQKILMVRLSISSKLG